ncbi:MBOAT family protein [Clostridium sp. Sa3CUN1]|uniref:MBOAT family protein n=1 Tax=Clostridium gallinarum TaxID=2762246 RepID=A0ABR8Q7U3_9CLOT|nr:MBOAT family protein [Clostridium gallinarum]MBD7916493.1 MBOAT family protein [Clostridium gallinarum]
MVFSSLLFIFRFLPIFFIIYIISPTKYRNLVLLTGSLLFYSFGEPKYFFIMIASILVDYFVGINIEKNFKDRKKCRYLLLISILFNMGSLFFFKYCNFFIENINVILGLSINKLSLTLPLGISFYSFQTLSYSIDVYRGDIKAERNIIDFGAFVSSFPQLIAGPIVKYSDINKEIKSENRKINFDNIEEGIELFIIGLAKKVLLANNIGILWTEIYSKNINDITMQLAWLGILAFSFQIYFDFSGYSSMAIGLGRMLGFTFPRNFNFPYISRSIREFWRRWHITLSSWLKEYIYIPLGGNRVGKFRYFFNLLILWFFTGFWHGAEYTFILWGLYFFVLVYIESRFIKDFLSKHIVLSHIYTIFFLLIGWCIFAIDDLKTLIFYLKKMFTLSYSIEWIYYFKNYFIVLIVCIISSTPLVLRVYNKLNKSIRVVIIFLLFIISIAYLVDSTYNPFLYFRF